MTDQFRPSGIAYIDDPKVSEQIDEWNRQQAELLKPPLHPTGTFGEVIAQCIPVVEGCRKFEINNTLHYVDTTDQSDIQEVLNRAVVFSLEGNHLSGKNTQEEIMRGILEQKGFTVLTLKNSGFVQGEEIAQYIQATQSIYTDQRQRAAWYRLQQYYDAERSAKSRYLEGSHELSLAQHHRRIQDQAAVERYERYLSESTDLTKDTREIDIHADRDSNSKGHAGEASWHLLQEILQFTLRNIFLESEISPSLSTGTPHKEKALKKYAVILNRGPITRLVNFAKDPQLSRYAHPYLTEICDGIENFGRNKVRRNPFSSTGSKKLLFMPLPFTIYIDAESDELIRRAKGSGRKEGDIRKAVSSIQRNNDNYQKAARRMSTYHSDQIKIVDGNGSVESTTQQLVELIRSRFTQIE
jgi:thymidylate kinase